MAKTGPTGPLAKQCESGARMREAGWYVVQVQAGQEHKLCVLMRAACENETFNDGSPLLEEAFSPTYRTRAKWGGEWRDVERAFLPGYVVAVTRDPAALIVRLRHIPEFTRLLTAGETFMPLTTDERTWLDEFTGKGERAIPMSFGYREGGRVVVTVGPLRGREALIERINRKKCLAYLSVEVAGKRITTKVGLGLLPKETMMSEQAGQPS